MVQLDLSSQICAVFSFLSRPIRRPSRLGRRSSQTLLLGSSRSVRLLEVRLGWIGVLPVRVVCLRAVVDLVPSLVARPLWASASSVLSAASVGVGSAPPPEAGAACSRGGRLTHRSVGVRNHLLWLQADRPIARGSPSCPLAFALRMSAGGDFSSQSSDGGPPAGTIPDALLERMMDRKLVSRTIRRGPRGRLARRLAG